MPKNIALPDPEPNGDAPGWQVVLSNDGAYRLDVTINGETTTLRASDFTAPQRTTIRSAVALVIAEAKAKLGYT
jgi:hypothetical protein